MLSTYTTNVRKPRLQLSIALMTLLLSPIAVTAEPHDKFCETTRKQIQQTHQALLPLKLQQEQIQRQVRDTYQELFACKTGTPVSLPQQRHCKQLEEEASQYFQAMIEAITLSHQTSQQLASRTHQAELNCSENSEVASTKITSLIPLQEISLNK